jgi:hypothetical protein
MLLICLINTRFVGEPRFGPATAPPSKDCRALYHRHNAPPT